MGADKPDYINPVQLADKLKKEADDVLQILNLLGILASYGKVYPTGSYYLEVMAYPDIDLYLTMVSLEQIFMIGAQIARCELVSQVVYEPTDDQSNLPGGLYLKFRVNYGAWGRPWKIDLWSLPEEVIVKKMAEMQHFKECMTGEIREGIIGYKHSVMTSQHRTPMYSGYHIYKAFIDESLTDFEDVSGYLRSKGIRLEEK
jgi:hypothetical protein